MRIKIILFTHQNLEVQTRTAQLLVWREEDCAECMLKQSIKTNKEMSEAAMSSFGSESDRETEKTEKQRTEDVYIIVWLLSLFPKMPFSFLYFQKCPPQPSPKKELIEWRVCLEIVSVSHLGRGWPIWRGDLKTHSGPNS